MVLEPPVEHRVEGPHIQHVVLEPPAEHRVEAPHIQHVVLEPPVESPRVVLQPGPPAVERAVLEPIAGFPHPRPQYREEVLERHSPPRVVLGETMVRPLPGSGGLGHAAE
eukprot:g11632.t1